MLRRQLVLLVTITALVAPWLAPCLAGAPGGHAAMACCHEGEPGVPAARACCLPADGQPSVPASPGAALVHAAPPQPVVWALAIDLPASRLREGSPPYVASAARTLRTVLLI